MLLSRWDNEKREARCGRGFVVDIKTIGGAPTLEAALVEMQEGDWVN